MLHITDKIKNIEILKKCFYMALYFSPYKILFRINLKRVDKFDKKNGTNFGGRLYWGEIGTTKERANDYSPSPKELMQTMRTQSIKTSDTIVDLGCGKGFAMYMMSKFPFSHIGGVELSSELCNVADENLKRIMPVQKKWKIYHSDAATWEKYDEYNIFYIYNSFPESVMREVKEKIAESLKRKPRKVSIWYLSPEHPEIFLEDESWKLIKRDSVFKLRHGMHIFVSR